MLAVLLHFLRAGPPLLLHYDSVMLTASIPDGKIRRACGRSYVEQLPELVCSDLLALLAKWVADCSSEERAHLVNVIAPFLLKPRDPSALSALRPEEPDNQARVVDDLIRSFELDETEEPVTSVKRNVDADLTT